MIKNKTLGFIIYLVTFLAFWLLLNFLFVTFITHGTFSTMVWNNLYIPAVCAITTWYLTFVHNK